MRRFATTHPGTGRLAAGLVLLTLAGSVSTGLAQSSEPAAAVPAAGAGAHGAPTDFAAMLFVFMLASFIGIGVIRRVSRLLHTPLMSLTNAISAIAVVGAIIVAGSDYPPVIRFLGTVALFASMTNIVSGFLITNRMLKMFKSNEEGRK
jgi:NAD(P) transhydrogenase subunit alpha